MRCLTSWITCTSMYLQSKFCAKRLFLMVTLEFNDTNMWKTLFGGDQLTVARARTAAYVRDDHDIASDKLHGLVPVIEDWHARMTFLKVSGHN